MTIELTTEQEEIVKRRVLLGRSNDAADVLREAFGLLEARDGKPGPGWDLIKAMQACPYPDFEFDFPRPPGGPVRDYEW